MNLKPEIIDWQITNRCTRNCIFCYGPIDDEQQLSISDSKRLIDRFCEFGCKVVGLTGGEPLLASNIIEILEYLKNKNVKIGFNTNCDLYNNYRENLLSMVDALEIPIEAGSQKIHDDLRGKGSFNAVIGALEDSYANSKVIYRIGTVLTPQNAEELPAIEKILADFADRIIYWKIYEYISYSNKSMMSINGSSESFNNANRYLFNKGLGSLINSEKIIFDSLSMRNKSYFLVKPNGTAFLPEIENGCSIELELGNMLSGKYMKVLDNWCSSVSVENYHKCIRCIFRKANLL